MTSKPATHQNKGPRRTSIALAGGAALALAVGVGLGTWQVHSHHGRAGTVSTSTARPAAPGTQLLIPTDQGHAGALPGVGVPGQAATVSGLSAYAAVPLSQTYTVYLVGTQAEADAVRTGPPAQTTTVWAVTDAASEAQAQETIARQNNLRVLVGLAPLTVVDLRTSATSAAADGPPLGGYADAWVQYQGQASAVVACSRQTPEAPC